MELNPFILAIETATEVCSVGLFQGETLIGVHELFVPQAHAKFLTTLVDSVMKAAGISYSELSSVAVSAGPGSYTGLRIGTSTAKGIAFAQSIPIIPIPTLQGIACQLLPTITLFPKSQIGVLLDARRMEVYYQFFTSELAPLQPNPQPVILTEPLLKSWCKQASTIFLGSGASKIRPFLTHVAQQSILLPQITGSVRGWGKLILEKWINQQIANLDTFEPDYIKPVMPTIEKPKL